MKCLSKNVGWIAVRKNYVAKIRLLLSSFLIFCSIFILDAQSSKNGVKPINKSKPITGVVVDGTGQPVVGATVILKETKTGTVTDLDGKFAIPNVTTKVLVEISYVGFEKKSIYLEPGQFAKVKIESNNLLNEIVVQVGFGTQKKINVTGSLSTVSSKEMLKSPVVNASQALVGRASGVFSRQNSGQPGNDNADFRIRGSGTYNSTGALVVVDGVERDFTQLDMNEIESLTVLKDAASTAVYGVRGANGVIVVTTKKGIEGPAKVSYTGNFAVNQVVRLPKFASSYDYATLRNEAELNDNPLLSPSQLSYSAKDIQLYKDGSDPIFHPNTDWYKLLMNEYSSQTQHNVNVSGGSKLAKYYVSIGYQFQDGLYKNFNQKYGYNNNDSYQRYNVRTNLDVNLTSSTKLNFNVGSISGIKNRDRSNGGYPTLYNSIPGSAAPYSPGLVDGKIVYLDGRRYSNVIEAMSTGFIKYNDNTIQSNIGIEQNLGFIIKGLSARAKYSYDTRYVYSVTRSRVPSVYVLRDTVANDVHQNLFTLFNSQDESIGGLSSTSFSSRSSKEYVEAGLNFDRSFSKHNVSALLLYTQNKTRFAVASPSAIPVSYMGLVNRLTYNFATRYFMEFNLGYNGSENFASGRRFGFFPAISGGWLLSDEALFKRYLSKDFISHLKLRGSYGIVGNDLGVGRFLYYPSSYTSSGGSRFGEGYNWYGGYYEDQLGNPLVTWEKSRKQDFGIDIRMLKQRLSISFDYFYEKRNDILGTRQTVPATFAAKNSVENIGIMINRGVETEVGWEDKMGDFSYHLKGNYAFVRNKVLYTDEAFDALNPYLARTGRRNEQPFGYKFIGFFKDANDVAQSPSQFSGASRPGDAKYADINGDGIINEKDQMPIGNPTYPEVNYGMSGGVSYKGFDFDFLFQGTANASVMVDGFMQKPSTEFGQILESVKNERWTPQTAATATRPILTVNYANQSNYLASTLWQRDASYLRLKNVQIGYNFNSRLVKKIGVSNLKLYLSGQNLITWDKLKIVDPENGKVSDLQYPQVAVYNIGVNVQF